jgi:hypothetical protein
VLLDTEITVINHLVEAASTFEQHFARVGGRGSAFGKTGLIAIFLRRLELIMAEVDIDRTVGKRKERRTGTMYVYMWGLQKLLHTLHHDVHGFDPQSILVASTAGVGAQRKLPTTGVEAEAEEPMRRVWPCQRA